MSEKILNTRIQLKYDTYENWTTNNPVLKAGEVAIATIPSNQGGVVNAPSVVFKVGDGTTAYNSLKFVSGLAADVYSWAKASTKPTYTAAEITGLSDFISGEIQDTDTQYRITKVDDYNYKLQSKAKGAADSTYADVSTIVIPKYDDTEVKADISALETLVGNTAVATQISNAISALDLANTYEPKGTGAKEAGKVQAALDSYTTTNDSVVYSIQNSLNSYKTTNDAVVSAVQSDISALNTKVGTVPDGKTVVEMISDAQDAATYDDTALKSRVSANETAISTLNGTGAGSVSKTVTDAINDFATKVSDDGTVNTFKELIDYAASHSAEFAELVGEVDANTAAIETLNGGDTVTGSVAKKIKDAIDAENLSQYATDTELAALTTEVNKKANNADLAAIAKTGNVNDLVQTSGDVLIFDCGNSVI